MKTLEQVELALSDWVIQYHVNNVDKFSTYLDDYEYVSIYCDGPYVGEDEDDDGNPIEDLDENMINYVLSADKYLAERIKYIKKCKKENLSSDSIEFDEKLFPNNFSNYDSINAWYYVDSGQVEFVPDLTSPEQGRLLENMKAFLLEFEG